MPIHNKGSVLNSRDTALYDGAILTRVGEPNGGEVGCVSPCLLLHEDVNWAAKLGGEEFVKLSFTEGT